MNKLYRCKEWLQYREEIFERDNYSCTKCGRKHDEVVLQVHHTRYFQGKKPWEYDNEDCLTLCRGCHAREHGEIRPSNGWELQETIDLENSDGNCELCGKQNIRYLCVVTHLNWEPMEVGSDCCDKLTGNSIASEYFTNHIRKLGRRNRFINSKRWIFDKELNGNTIRQSRYIFSIVKVGSEFTIIANFKSRALKSFVNGKFKYNNELDAKNAIFDGLESGAISRFFSKKLGELN